MTSRRGFLGWLLGVVAAVPALQRLRLPVVEAFDPADAVWPVVTGKPDALVQYRMNGGEWIDAGSMVLDWDQDGVLHVGLHTADALPIGVAAETAGTGYTRVALT